MAALHLCLFPLETWVTADIGRASNEGRFAHPLAPTRPSARWSSNSRKTHSRNRSIPRWTMRDFGWGNYWTLDQLLMGVGVKERGTERRVSVNGTAPWWLTHHLGEPVVGARRRPGDPSLLVVRKLMMTVTGYRRETRPGLLAQLTHFHRLSVRHTDARLNSTPGPDREKMA